MNVLLIEDDPIVMLGARQALQLADIRVKEATSVEAAMQQVAQACPAAILSDVRLPDDDGFELLKRMQALDREVPVILMTGHGDIRMAVEAMHLGAYDFLEKPFSSERLVEVMRRALEKRQLVLENRRLHALVAPQQDFGLVGQAPGMVEARRRIAALAPTQVDLLVRGETGTGKEVVARAIHEASGRSGPFVAINCGALPENIFESEMFGHEAGAFTGATRRRVGKLEYARGGTVFLDEIESMPMALQVKMLRVLQERQLERLGGNATVLLDCRVIAATKVDLRQLSTEGKFREDLYYRLGVVSVDLPRLNDRREDIPLLLAHFVQRAALRYQKTAPAWSAADMAQWQQRDWPGNVRELRNFADQLVLGVADMGSIRHATAPSVSANSEGDGLPRRLDAYEASLILAALRASDFNVAVAADSLGIPKKTLYDKLKKHNIPVGRS